MTHKRKPSFNLLKMQELLQDRKTRGIPRGPRRDAGSIGYPDDDDIVNRLLDLRKEHFRWSMTQHYDSRIWQDVYKLPQDDYTLYIKLQIGDDGKCWVRSFKIDEEEGY